MAWGVRWYLVGSIVLGVLGVLAGCSGSMFFAEREPWRHDAEVQCLSTGAVKEGAGIPRAGPIRGPGICGADFPLKVSILGEGAPLGYGDDLRPPADIPRGAPRWPIRPAPAPAEPPYQSRVLPEYQVRPPPAAGRDTVPDEPVSLNPPGAVDAPNVPAEPYDFRKPYGVAPAAPARRYPMPAGSPREDLSPEPYERRPLIDAPAALRNGSSGVSRAPLREPPVESPRTPAREPVVPLGPSRDTATAFTPVAVSPPATLACPMVSELERKITVKNGWHGLPEEQGFLRDVQAAACDQFSTVLAPGSNVYHYDHIHVDLMRRRDGRHACNPNAVSGEEAAARAARYAGKRDPGITGSLAPGRSAAARGFEERRPRRMPVAEPGQDGEA